MASSLPGEYVVLKSEDYGEYLQYVEEGPAEGYVRSSGVDVHSPLSKFHVEPAHSDSHLVHLRCCYNDKYLVAASAEGKPWIVCAADKPEEDQSKWSCTLFQLTPCGGDDYIFKHVASGNYVGPLMMLDSRPEKKCLCAYFDYLPALPVHVCTIIDWKSLVVLPRLVAFKRDGGCFYGVGHPLQGTTSDSGDPIVAQEVFPNPDGSIRIKSTYTGKFWRRGSDNWIWADNDTQDGSDINTLFWPVKLDDTTIALRSLGNDQFIKRYTADGVDSGLNANISTISREARLIVTELVLDRDIYNVNYHLSRARRYNEQGEVIGTGAASNTTDKENSMDVTVAHTETDTNSWGGSVSLKLGVKTTLKTGVPMIAEGKIEISAELTTAFQWGVVHTKTNTIQTVYKALVPPMTKVTVTAVGTTAKCDIPYSYNQTDTLMDGRQHTYEMGGGTYTGVKTFNVTYQIKEEKINITE